MRLRVIAPTPLTLVFAAAIALGGCTGTTYSGSVPAEDSGALGVDAAVAKKAPALSVRDAHPVLAETKAVVFVVLSHAWHDTVRVELTTLDDSATGDPTGAGDYQPLKETVIIPPGSLAAKVEIPVSTPYKTITLDTALSKRFLTRLSNPQGGATIDDADGVVTLAQPGMVIETPLAKKLADADVVPDFNGDSKTDLVLTGLGGRAVLLLTPGVAFEESAHLVVDDSLLDGKRAFSWHVSTGAGFSAYGGFVAADHSMANDFNGDGLSDLLVVGEGRAHLLYGSKGPFSNFASADARLSDGVNGTELTDIYFGYGGSTMQVGDWNGDGITDWAQARVYSSSHPGSTDQFYVFYGEKGPYGGKHGAKDTLSFASGTQAVGQASLYSGAFPGVRADLNGDGLDDVVFVGLSANDGKFGGHYLYVRFSETQKATGNGTDLRGELHGNNGFYVSDSTYGKGAFIPQDAGDLNGDGIEDLVVTGGGKQMTVIFGKKSAFAAGSYAKLDDLGGEAAFFETDKRPATARVGDLNKDGIADLVFITENKLRVLWGKKGLTGRKIVGTQYPELGEIEIDPASGLDRVEVVGDVDGDGTADIVLVSSSWKGDTGGAVILFGKTVTRALGGPELDRPKID